MFLLLLIFIGLCVFSCLVPNLNTDIKLFHCNCHLWPFLPFALQRRDEQLSVGYVYLRNIWQDPLCKHTFSQSWNWDLYGWHVGKRGEILNLSGVKPDRPECRKQDNESSLWRQNNLKGKLKISRINSSNFIRVQIPSQQQWRGVEQGSRMQRYPSLEPWARPPFSRYHWHAEIVCPLYTRSPSVLWPLDLSTPCSPQLRRSTCTTLRLRTASHASVPSSRSTTWTCCTGVPPQVGKQL